MRELTVNVEGLIFSGMRGPFAIGPDGFDGWDDGVEMRVTDMPRPQAHFSYDLPVFAGSRIVNLTGYVLATSVAELEQLSDRVTGLLAGGQKGRIVVTKNGRTRWADCRLATQTKFTERHGQPTGDFQIQLWCADGRKYGESRDFVRTNGTVSVFHRGNFNAHPTVVVRGSAANGYRLNGPGGKQYKVSRPLVTGLPHRIEFNDGRLRVNGTLVSTGTDSADIWPVPPGQAVDFDINVINGGTAEATITILDTYI